MTEHEAHARIVVDPQVLAGKPIIKGTRMAVAFVVELCSNGWDLEAILTNYPTLTRDDVLAALHYAADVLKLERIYPLPEHA